MKTSTLRIWNITWVGFRAIARNKLRSVLTTLGIVIGVACVIAMIAIGAGASSSIQATINSLGTNFIMIHPGAQTQGGARMFGSESKLSLDDVEAIRAEVGTVAYTSPGVRTAGQIVSSESNWSTSIYGTGVDWPFIRAWNVEDGTFFTESEERSAAKVVVLGATVADELFPGGSAVSEIVRIRNVPFRVIGVLERKGGSMMGSDQDDQIIVPYTTAMKRLMGTTSLGLVYVSATSENLVPEAMEEITLLLRQRHRIPSSQPDDFMIRSQEEIAARAADMSKTMSYLLGTVAAISLLVGGIGIMNIMLVSVTERTREIGIRMAVGAKGRHVLLQFLLEAITLSVVGGLLGVLLGIAASQLVSRFAGWPVEVTPESVALEIGRAHV